MTARNLSCNPIYLVELAILIVASENRAEISDIHIIAVASYFVCTDISMNAVHLVHLFQTIDNLHCYI